MEPFQLLLVQSVYTLFPAVQAPTPSVIHSTLQARTISNLTCNYSLMDYFPHDTRATWIVDKSDLTQNDRILIEELTLSFFPLKTSDSGMYCCELSITSLTPHVIIEESPKTSAELPIVVESKSIHSTTYSLLFQIYLIVPPPDVAVSLNRSGPLYAGTDLTISCTVTLDQSVNNNETVSIHWNGTEEMQEQFVGSSTVSTFPYSYMYTSFLTISPLTAGDGTVVNCTGTITGVVDEEINNSNSVIFDVEGEG